RGDVGRRVEFHLLTAPQSVTAGADLPALGVQCGGSARGRRHVAGAGRLNTDRTAATTRAAQIPITTSIGIAEWGPARPVSGETSAARLNCAAPSSADPEPERPRVACIASAAALGMISPIDRVSRRNPTVTGASARVPAGERPA